jgi:hypothetical protein
MKRQKWRAEYGRYFSDFASFHEGTAEPGLA